MGEILPFIARVRESSDWTAAERARLEDLAQRFAEAAPGVEAVFGATEEGDPWCVVKDADEEVLVHVARIGGRFVVHYAVGDAVEEGGDLHSALGARLAETVGLASGDDEDVVVHARFGTDARHVQTLAALLIATAFFYDTEPVQAAEATEAQAMPQAEQVDAAPLEAMDLDTMREAPAKAAAALTEPAEQTAAPRAAAISATEPDHDDAAHAAPVEAVQTASPEPIPAPEPVAVEETPVPAAPPVQTQTEFNLIVGTSGDDTLQGTSGADLMIGGDGDDVLRGGGAPSGQFDTLLGGAGDDVIEMNGQVVAIGGSGGDTFVFTQLPPPSPEATGETLLGFIVDFRAQEGDRMVNRSGEAVRTFVRPDAQISDGEQKLLASFNGGAGGRRVEIDLDGDGAADGYVVMGMRAYDRAVASGLDADDIRQLYVTGRLDYDAFG